MISLSKKYMQLLPNPSAFEILNKVKTAETNCSHTIIYMDTKERKSTHVSFLMYGCG